MRAECREPFWRARFVDFRSNRPDGKDHPDTDGTTFTFLDFCHVWGKSRKGKNVVRQVSYAAIAAMVAPSIHADRNSENVTLWDIAGTFTLTGCTAAIFSEPDQLALHSSSYSNGPRMRHGGVNHRRAWLPAGCQCRTGVSQKARVETRGRWEV